MNYFRISKYNPIHRENGIYKKHEWTSFSDIGKICDHHMLSETEYLTVEKQYTDTIYEIAKFLSVETLTINYLENYQHTTWEPFQKLTLLEAVYFMQDCLRDLCWGQLVSDNFVWEVGYDFYMHIGCNLTFEKLATVVNTHKLFIENWEVITLH